MKKLKVNGPFENPFLRQSLSISVKGKDHHNGGKRIGVKDNNQASSWIAEVKDLPQCWWQSGDGILGGLIFITH